MGLHLNWLAVEGGDTAAVLARLGFRPSGVASNPLLARFACATLPNGWFVIVSSEFALDLSEVLPAASADGLAVGCEMTEIAMGSGVKAYRNGRRVWAVDYDGGNGPAEPTVEGEAPAELADILARQRQQQAEAGDEPVDFMFDAPLELARAVCGFRVEALPPVEWTVLRAGEDRDRTAAPGETLADRICSELTPLLQSLGWEAQAGRLASPGLYDVARMRGGRLQGLAFNWKHDNAEIYFVPTFAVWQGETKDSPVLVSGMTTPARERFWTRFRNLFAPAPDPEDRLAQVVAQARREILALDRFLTTGECDIPVQLRRGSAEDLRPVAP